MNSEVATKPLRELALQANRGSARKIRQQGWLLQWLGSPVSVGSQPAQDTSRVSAPTLRC